jgi:hypothetical protein
MDTMKNLKLSANGEKLIDLYDSMAAEGYHRTDGKRVNDAYNDFELKRFRDLVLPYFKEHEIKSVLDYGCGGSDWERLSFDEGTAKSAKDFFNLDAVSYYEPARGIDQRQKVDCVSCFDVLEHVFISDVATVLRDILSYAQKLVVINIACYDAKAMLPNGENAHITVRDPMWWKGMLDSISIDFPAVNILLLASPGYQSAQVFELWNATNWNESQNFKIDLSSPKVDGESKICDRDLTLSKPQFFELIHKWIETSPENAIELIDSMMEFLQKSNSDK